MRDIDLNLLPIFEALYEERGVSRAAIRLGVTQSAVSQALGRLRHSLADPLFVRSARSLMPTARAQQLAPLARELLSRWREACKPGSFDPADSTREFRLVVGNFVGDLLLPAVLSEMQRQSAGVRLRVWNMNSHLAEWLETGLVDIGIGTFEHLPKRTRAYSLFQHRYVWVARKDHAATSMSSLDDVRSLPRLEITVGEGPVSSKGVWQEGGMHRRAMADIPSMLPPLPGSGIASAPRFSVHHWRVACDMISSTDLVAIMSERLAAIAVEHYDAVVLAQFPPVFSSDLSVVWDDAQTNDPGNRWLRGLITAAAATMPEPNCAEGLFGKQ